MNMSKGEQRKDECIHTLSQEEKETEGWGMKRKRNIYEVNGLKAWKGYDMPIVVRNTCSQTPIKCQPLGLENA